MKNINLGQTLTILANIGVIAGIGLLAYELRQAQDLARAEIYQSFLANEIAIGNAIASNKEICTRGNDGELSDASEMAVYSRLVQNLNDAAYFRRETDLMLGQYDGAAIEHAEFALFLHRNREAYAVWQDRMDDLMTFREIVDPGNPFADPAIWETSIVSAISEFETFDNDVRQ